jgi:rubrerythrin
MPEFVKPFAGMVPARKIAHSELIRAIRLNLAAEEEATHLYESHADATDNELARKVLHDIADEERVHVGEFQRLLSILDPAEDKWLADGAAEVNEMAAEVGRQAPPAAEPARDIPTIGDLKG